MMTVGLAVQDLARRLAEAGVGSARLDARLLVAEATGQRPEAVFGRPERPLSAGEAARLDALAGRRAAREPISHILGRRGFWTLDLAVTADTLDPRPDTETVVEAVLEAFPDRARRLRILDLGTGTGCILLALLSEFPNATGLGIDASLAAVAVAGRNVESSRLSLRAQVRHGDWGRGLDECFDAIVSNPPYIPDQDIGGLEPEVASYEPRLALSGGPDGLECYRVLAPDIARLLAPGGIAALEVGAGQAQSVVDILSRVGLGVKAVRCDLAGTARCVVAVHATERCVVAVNATERCVVVTPAAGS